MKTIDTPNITGEKYHVVIDSIGSANPSASKMLSEVLGTPVEIVVKALYNTPSILFSNIDLELAEQSTELLEKLGIVAHKQPIKDPLPEKKESVDVGVYIHNISTIPTVAEKLGDFLGCSTQDAFNLLTADPCVVMGSVSEATAQALCDRLATEVIVSAPKTDLYTLFINQNEENRMLLHKLQSHLNYLKLEIDLAKEKRIVNLNYDTAHGIWKKFQSTGLLKLINQSFQRFEINLVEVDTSNPGYRKALIEGVEMPEEIIEEVIENLPIQLESSANGKTVAEKIEAYKLAGLKCTAHIIKPNNYKLIIEENGDLKKSQAILGQYLETQHLPTSTERWEFPRPLGDLLFRCITAELEHINCEIDYDYFE